MVCLGCNGSGYVTVAVHPVMMQPALSTTTVFSPSPHAVTELPVAINPATLQPALLETATAALTGPPASEAGNYAELEI